METFHAATMFALSIILVLSALDVKADLQDGIVYTDGKKHVIRGDDVVLKCQFRGLPLAVYWKKGNDPRSAPNLITWFGNEQPTGSCIEDGTCALDDDFSLILKRAKISDTGRYICNASYYGGISHHNFTDVKIIDLDPVGVYTEPYVTGWAGFSVSLPCIFRVEAKTVLWERVYWNTENIANEIILRYTEGEYEVLGDRRYSWSKSNGLIIRDLNITDEGNCTCLVSTFDGIEKKNSTILAVKDPGQLSIYTEPYVTGWVGSSVSLPCNFTVQAQEVLWERFYWDNGTKVHIILRYASAGTEAPGASRYSWSENYGLIITDLHVSDEGNFTCLVSTIDGIEIKNSTVLTVNVSATQSSTVTTVVVVVVIVMVVLVLIIFVMIRIKQYKTFTKNNTGTRFRSDHHQTMTRDCFRWVFCCKKQVPRNVEIEMQALSEQQPLMTPEGELDNLRKQLKEYRPAIATDSENTERFPGVISLGVFGLMGAGKSSLINSLNFALNNKLEDAVVSGAGDGGETEFMGPILLTKHISIWFRTLEDLSIEQMDDSLMPQISGERGRNPGGKLENGEMIHCPIFIHDIRTPEAPMWVFLKAFSGSVCLNYGRHVMVVVTHKEEADCLETFKDDIVHLGIPHKHIWPFENYTKTNNNHNVEKSISYLRFLRMCLEIGENNLQCELRKRRERRKRREKIPL